MSITHSTQQVIVFSRRPGDRKEAATATVDRSRCGALRTCCRAVTPSWRRNRTWPTGKTSLPSRRPPAPNSDPDSKDWFTTSFLGGRCRKAMLGVRTVTQTRQRPHRQCPASRICFRVVTAFCGWVFVGVCEGGGGGGGGRGGRGGGGGGGVLGQPR